MFNKAVRLAQVGRTEEAARAHGELARFRDAPEEDIQVQIAMALYNPEMTTLGTAVTRPENTT